MHSNDNRDSTASTQPSPVDNAAQDAGPKDASGKLTLRHILTSVVAAAFGVQSKKNQQKDFSHKQAIYIYIVAGIVFTALFVFAVAFVVSIVLTKAG